MRGGSGLFKGSLLTVVGASCVVLAACGGSGGKQTSPDGGDDSAVVGDGPPAIDARVGSKRIFVTSTAYSGNLGGNAGADALCLASSDAVGLGGNWTAWISTSASDAFSRVADVSPWYLLDGSMVFPNKASLKTTPAVGITITERGMTWVGYVWTGTLSGAIHSADDCAGFTSASSAMQGTVGAARASDTTGWTAFESDACQLARPIYCLEQ